jgi:hypothetical protein
MAIALQVQFNPAPAYLFDYLTADIQTSECIFDLIDNSIDAARAVLSRRSSEKNGQLPDNYAGFQINVTLSPEAVTVHDNCSGISEETFSSLAFRAGEKSQHPFGIGHFGVGLKRAILKIGDRCSVSTDDGLAKLELVFTRQQLDNSQDLTLPARKFASTGSTFTTIEVTDIKSDTKRDLSGLRWNETLRENIGRRYGLFIRKGLAIIVNGAPISTFAPQPRDDRYIQLQKFNAEMHGVQVDIVAGVHERYRFGQNASGNIGADPQNHAVHKEIAKEYGWYVVCNDRVILLHDTSYKTGWTTNWHPEYAGFVGWISFSAKDPALLPWNTKKSDIVENGELYEELIPVLQRMATQYRHTTPLAKGRRNPSSSSPSPNPTSTPSPAPSPTSSPGPRSQPTPVTAKAILEGLATKQQLSSIATLLPKDSPFASKMPKLAGLVDEAERLVIEDFPYAAAIMLRTLFESALRDFLKRHKHFTQMRDDVLQSNLKDGQPQPTDAQRKNYTPLLSDMVRWCINNSTVFPDPYTRACKLSCERFAKHLTLLNGVIHEDSGIANAGQVRTMRDEVLEGLLHIFGS